MVELLGLFASAIIIISFIFNNPQKIRIINTIGGVMFLLYGILIGSLSTIVLQVALIIIQMVKLYKNKGVKK